MLTSVMTWRAPSTDPGAMDGEYGDTYTVENVRFERTDARASGGYANQYQRYDGPTGTVFIDAARSVGEVPPVGALASVDGSAEMAVVSVDELRGPNGEVHHWEVTLG